MTFFFFFRRLNLCNKWCAFAKLCS